MNTKKRVLIVCTGNSCRSQMAEGLWNHLAGGEWIAFSAGSLPAGYVHPLAVAAMNEIGLDISSHHSKPVDTFAGQSFDLVVTVCDYAKETCPALPEATQTLHWPFHDPFTATGSEEARLATFREVRDQIADQIRAYLRTERRNET
jgi:arsenate reductase